MYWKIKDMENCYSWPQTSNLTLDRTQVVYYITTKTDYSTALMWTEGKQLSWNPPGQQHQVGNADTFSFKK